MSFKKVFSNATKVSSIFSFLEILIPPFDLFLPPTDCAGRILMIADGVESVADWMEKMELSCGRCDAGVPVEMVTVEEALEDAGLVPGAASSSRCNASVDLVVAAADADADPTPASKSMASSRGSRSMSGRKSSTSMPSSSSSGNITPS